MVHRTRQVNGTQVRHNVLRGSLVEAFSGGHHVDLLEFLEQLGGRLVNGADYGATLTGQVSQQVNDLIAGMCV